MDYQKLFFQMVLAKWVIRLCFPSNPVIVTLFFDCSQVADVGLSVFPTVDIFEYSEVTLVS